MQTYKAIMGGLCLLLVLGTGCEAPSSPPTSSDYKQTFFAQTPQAYTAWVYEVDLDSSQLVLIDGNKRRFEEIMDSNSQPYLMLMNAGMFHKNGRPVGLFYNQQHYTPLNTDSTSKGNFFMQPNGVFYVTRQGQAGVLPTADFAAQIDTSQLLLATQSGPLLLMDSQFHPAFRAASTSQYVRNGVGVQKNGRVVFILAEQPVNFHTFASLFLEKGCVQALYLDGAISGMYISDARTKLEDFRTAYGPVLGVLPILQ